MSTQMNDSTGVQMNASSGVRSSLIPPLFEKAFVVGLGTIPAKLVSKITSCQLVNLADLLSAKLHVADH